MKNMQQKMDEMKQARDDALRRAKELEEMLAALCAEFEKYKTGAQSREDSIKAQLSDCRRQLEEIGAQLREVTSQLNQAKAERDRAYAERDAANAEKNALKMSLSSRPAGGQVVDGSELNALRQQLEALRAQYQEAQDMVANLNSELNTLREENEELTERVAEYQQQIHQLETEMLQAAAELSRAKKRPETQTQELQTDPIEPEIVEKTVEVEKMVEV